MRIIKQLSEDEFVIKLDDYDKKFKKPVSLEIAHDYVMFRGRFSISTDYDQVKNLFGPYAWASNMIGVSTDIQIPIKMFCEKIMPVLIKSKYLKPEHLKTGCYNDNVEILRWNDEETQKSMVSLKKPKSDWEDMTSAEYYHLHKDNIEFDSKEKEKIEKYIEDYCNVDKKSLYVSKIKSKVKVRDINDAVEFYELIFTLDSKKVTVEISKSEWDNLINDEIFLDSLIYLCCNYNDRSCEFGDNWRVDKNELKFLGDYLVSKILPKDIENFKSFCDLEIIHHGSDTRQKRIQLPKIQDLCYREEDFIKQLKDHVLIYRTERTENC